MTIRVIFDLDGTIIDTENEIAQIVSDIASDCGCPLSLKVAFCDYAGMSFKHRFNTIANAYDVTFSSEKLQKMHEEYTRRKEEMFNDPRLPTIKGVKALLERLHSNTNIELVLATSNTTTRANKVLKNLGLSKFFGDRVFGSNMTNGQKKPNPAIHTLAMGNHSPENCLVVEDSIVGIQSANAAGAYVVNFFDSRLDDGTGERKQMHYVIGADLLISDYNKFEEQIAKHWEKWPKSEISQNHIAPTDTVQCKLSA